ncbi:unnamed protein product [Dovyalis caffra]|uniref:F-box domain-containing protein n=1 Tax=Dovyalis caffra TaxID=77055 RepID=A0AAV1R498_9ROSI|nr:unnamed protein product [Dovyalis caffra]
MEKTHDEGERNGEFEECNTKVGSDDIVDSLPADPFGMDIKFSRLTASFEDFDGDLGYPPAELGTNGDDKSVVDDGVFVGLDLFFNSAWGLQPQKGNLNISAVSTQDHSFSGSGVDCGVNAGGFEDFDGDLGSPPAELGTNGDDKSVVDDDVVVGLDLFFNDAWGLQPQKGNLNISAVSTQDHSFSGSGVDCGVNAGGFEDFDGDLGSPPAELGTNGDDKSVVDDGVFVGLDLFFNGAWGLQPQKGNLNISAVSTQDHSFSGSGVDCGVNAGGFEDFDGDLGSPPAELGTNGDDKSVVDDGVFVGLDLFFNGAWGLQPQKGNLNISAVSTQDHSFSGSGVDCGVNAGGFDSETNISNWDDCEEGTELGGEPHDALFFALGYLRVKDLLMVEKVCRSLCAAVRGDTLLWRSIHIDQPLSDKITNEALFKLTNRAQGTLQSLSLGECIRITDSGLMQVLESNPRLTKLCVPGCVNLTIDGILFNLRALKSSGTLIIKRIRIGGLFGVTEKQFEELESLLGVGHMHPRAKNLQFHRVGQLYPCCDDDDRAIDVERCPKCQKVKLVYDCPAESCQGKDQANQLCRACTLCIPRCSCCGCCIKDCEYVETFCLDFLCFGCLKQLFNCQEKPEVNGAPSSGHTIFQYETRLNLADFSLDSAVAVVQLF